MTENSRKPYHRLTDAQWSEAGVLWERGEASLRELSERFGVREETLSRGLKARGHEKGAKAEEHSKNVAEHVEKTLMNDAAAMAARIRATKEDHYKYAETLAKLIMKEIIEAQRNSRPVALAHDSIKTLRMAAQALQTVRGERWVLLGLDKDDAEADELPELLVSVLNEEKIAEIQQGTNELDELDLDGLDDGIEVEGEDDKS